MDSLVVSLLPSSMIPYIDLRIQLLQPHIGASNACETDKQLVLSIMHITRYGISHDRERLALPKDSSDFCNIPETSSSRDALQQLSIKASRCLKYV